MKKLYFFFIASVFLAMTASASPMSSNMGDVKDVPIRREGTQEENDRPHAPALRLFSAFVDTDSNALFVSSRYDVGEVSATIENLSTGDFYSYTFDSADSQAAGQSRTQMQRLHRTDRAVLHQKRFSASMTYPISSSVIPGYSGMLSSVSASISATGKSPLAYPSGAYAFCRWIGIG